MQPIVMCDRTTSTGQISLVAHMKICFQECTSGQIAATIKQMDAHHVNEVLQMISPEQQHFLTTMLKNNSAFMQSFV